MLFCPQAGGVGERCRAIRWNFCKSSKELDFDYRPSQLVRQAELHGVDWLAVRKGAHQGLHNDHSDARIAEKQMRRARHRGRRTRAERTQMAKLIPVIDLFAGPGGLGEGFSALGLPEGKPLFKICLSIEKDPFAHATLELRSFYRQFLGAEVPTEYYAVLRGEMSRDGLFELPKFAAEAERARAEAVMGELGDDGFPPQCVGRHIRRALGGSDTWVLIGGPPCQAYSIVGRSRRMGVKSYKPEEDERHYLYREYLRIIAEHWPSIFVMENVKGLLSAKVGGEEIFHQMLNDLASPSAVLKERRRGPRWRYRIYSLVRHSSMFDDFDGKPTDFVIPAEDYGIPQTRHRVILIGIRQDLGAVYPQVLQKKKLVPASAVLNGLPRLRAGLSRKEDSDATWRECIQEALLRRWLDSAHRTGGSEVFDLLLSTIANLAAPRKGRGGEFVPYDVAVDYMPGWFLDGRLGGVCNHSTREHIGKDLHRYLYAACFARVRQESPKLRDFPRDLLPNHRNVEEGIRQRHFADRFRVQVASRPATTVVSHIHKDGHYYIHYDPSQCRSLTVREAARLQTFPDNYFFCGPRTAQYIQVGNAVPPLLAREIAQVIGKVLAEAEIAD